MAHYHLDPARRGFGFQHGTANGCPFCIARSIPRPNVGTTLVFLSGYDAGQTAVVVQDHGWAEHDGLLAARMNYGARNVMIVNPALQLYIEARTVSIPAWMPPLSIEDAGALHEQVLERLQLAHTGKAQEAAERVMSAIVLRCWNFRLPLTFEEVWTVLIAHGMRPDAENACADLFGFGMALLVAANGRPPVNRRRMPPLSKGRYAAQARTEPPTVWARLAATTK